MPEISQSGSLSSRIDKLHGALTEEVGRAEGANGRIAISCTADGLIRDWYVDPVLHTANVSDVVRSLVALQREAVEYARSAVREAAEAISQDPELIEAASSTADLPDPPARGFFEDPVGRVPRRRQS